MSDELLAALPDSAPPPESPESPARPFDGAAMARLRWAGGTRTLPDLCDLPSAKVLLAALTKQGFRELRRLRRSGKPIPPVMIGNISKAIEAFLRASSDELDRGELTETRNLLKSLKSERAAVRRRA